MGNGLIGLIVPLAVAATFALARRHLAASSMKPPEGEYLNIPFDGTWTVNTCIVLVGILFAFSTHAGFVWLSRYIATTNGSADFLLWPQSAIWWFFPGFGALTLSWEIVLQLWAHFGNRGRAYSFNYWWAQTAGFDSTRVLRWMSVFITLPIGILTALALPMHTALGQDEIRDCGYAFSGCQIYRYADARRLTEIEGMRDRQGNLTRRAGIVVDFVDGRNWSSAEIGDFEESVGPVFAQFLENKTHLPLHHAETASDIPRLDLVRETH